MERPLILATILALAGVPGCAPRASHDSPYGGHPDGGADGSPGSQDGSPADTDTDADTDGDTDVDTDTDTNTGTDTGDTETVEDAGADTDGDADTDTEDTDTGAAWCSGLGVWLDTGWAADLDLDGIDDTFYPGTRCWQDPPAPTTMPWADAVAYCEALDLAGYTDWVLPTVNDLRLLGRPNTPECAACGLSDPGDLAEADAADCEACIPLFGGNGAGGCYWPEGLDEVGCDGGSWAWPIYWSTSELWEDQDGFAWSWEFHSASPGIGARNKVAIAKVRCVRVLD